MDAKDVKTGHNLTRVVFRPLARSDISDIWDFIAEDSVLQADSWVDDLDEKLRTLATQPLMGRAREELFVNLRSHPFGRYAYNSMIKKISRFFITLPPTETSTN